MVLVVGATGLVGGEVCRKLAVRGEKVRALVRTTSAKEKTEDLRSRGVELAIGDLKDSASLAAACRGVDTVISTASSTLSRQAGDTIESVDAAGQMSLVNAAKAAHIQHFIFVSFRRPPGFSFPLGDAKRDVEEAIEPMSFTVIQASYFMEVWLGPELGFDYVGAKARICGPGTAPISWVSFADVAEMCAVAVRHSGATRRTIAFGGPQSLSFLETVALFEKIGGKPFTVEHIPAEALLTQFQAATDSMQKSFAALMLGSVKGDAMDMTEIADEFGIRLTTIEAYARSVLSKSASA